MLSSPKRIFRTAIGLVLAGVFLYFAFRGVNLQELWSTLLQVNVEWVIVLVPVGLASHWVRAWRWGYLLRPMKRATSTRNLFSAVMIGYMVNNTLPRAGEVVRAYVAGKLEGISKSSTLGSVVAERMIDMISFFFILCLVFFVYPNALNPFVDDAETLRPLFLIGSIAGIALFVLLFVKIDALERLVKPLSSILPQKYQPKIERLTSSFVSGFGVAKMPETFAPVIGLSFLMWLLYALGMYVIFFAFDALVDLRLGFGAAVVLLTISTIAFILPAPGAFGTFHSFLTFALVKLYGVDNVTALGYTIVVHEVGFVTVAVVGLFYFLRDNFKLAEVSAQAGGG